MTGPAPVDHLLDFLHQQPRTRADEWLQDGIVKWMQDGGTLSALRCLGLPASPNAVWRELRNRYLCEAAAMLDDDVYLAVQKLHAHLIRYRRRWDVLKRLSAPPPGASDLEQILFKAFKAHLPPKGRQMLGRIVYQKFKPNTQADLYGSSHHQPKENDDGLE